MPSLPPTDIFIKEVNQAWTNTTKSLAFFLIATGTIDSFVISNNESPYVYIGFLINAVLGVAAWLFAIGIESGAYDLHTSQIRVKEKAQFQFFTQNAGGVIGIALLWQYLAIGSSIFHLCLYKADILGSYPLSPARIAFIAICVWAFLRFKANWDLLQRGFRIFFVSF